MSTQPPRIARILHPDKHRIRSQADAEQHVLDAMGLHQWWTVTLLTKRTDYGEPHVRTILLALLARGVIEHAMETPDQARLRIRTRGVRSGARRCLHIYRRVV